MSGELILIVEDHELNRKLVRDVLQVKGYRTLETETAEEGLRVVHTHRPALILMDILLPGMSGIDALKSLRGDRQTSSIPVIAMTASGLDQQRSAVIGFDAFERKPISVLGLLKTVRHLLDRYSSSP